MFCIETCGILLQKEKLINGGIILIKVYHGTNFSSAFDIFTNGIDLSKSMPNLDFGKGFYVTDNERKAIDRALKKTNDYNRRNNSFDKAFVVSLSICESMFNSLHVKSFDFREKEWFQFVINNRLDISFLNEHKITNHNKDNKYDVVFGEIADGKIAEIANDVKYGTYDISDIDYSLILQKTKEHYCNQYSFHTEKSLSCIKVLSCDIIKFNK